MVMIRKLEPVGLETFCCDFNDICEGTVTHKVIDDGSTNEKYYCEEHVDVLREKLTKT